MSALGRSKQAQAATHWKSIAESSSESRPRVTALAGIANSEMNSFCELKGGRSAYEPRCTTTEARNAPRARAPASLRPRVAAAMPSATTCVRCARSRLSTVWRCASNKADAPSRPVWRIRRAVPALAGASALRLRVVQRRLRRLFEERHRVRRRGLPVALSLQDAPPGALALRSESAMHASAI